MENTPPDSGNPDSDCEKQRTLAALIRLRNALVQTALLLRDVHYFIDECASEAAERDVRELLKKFQ